MLCWDFLMKHLLNAELLFPIHRVFRRELSRKLRSFEPTIGLKLFFFLCRFIYLLLCQRYLFLIEWNHSRSICSTHVCRNTKKNWTCSPWEIIFFLLSLAHNSFQFSKYVFELVTVVIAGSKNWHQSSNKNEELQEDSNMHTISSLSFL